MTIFIDAAALAAIVKDEPEAHNLLTTIETHEIRLTSGLAMWEAIRAVAKASKGNLTEATRLCERFRIDFEITMIPVADAEAMEAIEAHRHYGKGSGHPPVSTWATASPMPVRAPTERVCSTRAAISPTRTLAE